MEDAKQRNQNRLNSKLSVLRSKGGDSTSCIVRWLGTISSMKLEGDCRAIEISNKWIYIKIIYWASFS